VFDIVRIAAEVRAILNALVVEGQLHSLGPVGHVADGGAGPALYQLQPRFG